MHRFYNQRGELILDALLALSLVGLISLGAVGLGTSAVHISSEAAHLDAALAIARQCLADLDQVSWHRLPQYFSSAESRDAAALDTADLSAPADWSSRAASLPGGRIIARLDGLTSDGRGCAFDSSLGLRVSVVVSYRESERTRHVTLQQVRL